MSDWIRVDHGHVPDQVVNAVNLALRQHNLEFVNGVAHDGFVILTLRAIEAKESAVAGGHRADRNLDWHMLHVNSCEDASCEGCKFCKRCEADGIRDVILTRCVGFEDHLCFNCRHPPSD